jgi:hypothetical protein
VDACHLAPPWAVATPSRIGGGNDIWEVCSWENPPMPSDDDFRTLEEAVSAELHRLIAAILDRDRHEWVDCKGLVSVPWAMMGL